MSLHTHASPLPVLASLAALTMTSSSLWNTGTPSMGSCQPCNWSPSHAPGMDLSSSIHWLLPAISPVSLNPATAKRLRRAQGK